MRDLTAQRYRKQGAPTSIFMVLTIISAAFVIVSQKFLFSLVTVFFAILWVAFSVLGKKEDSNNNEYSSPDLEGMFIRWVFEKIKKLFGKG